MIKLLYGEDEVSLRVEVRAIVANFESTQSTLGIEWLDFEEAGIERINEVLCNTSLFVPRKLVVAYGVFHSKQTVELFIRTIPAIPDTIDVIVIEPKPDKRTGLFRQLHKNKQAREFPALKAQQLVSWLVDYASGLQASLSPQNARELIKRVGENQAVLAREIEKMAPHQDISPELIATLTDSRLDSTIFDMLEATFQKRGNQSLAIYDDLVAAEIDPNEIFGMIVWQLHALAKVYYAKARSSSEAAQRIGMHPFAAARLYELSKSVTQAKLKNYLRQSADTDYLIKTSPVQAEDAVRILLLELST